MRQDLGEIISLLTVGMNHSAIYFADHPRVTGAAEELAVRLAGEPDPDEPEGLFLGVAHGRLVHAGKPLLGPTLTARRVIETAARLRSGGFLFQAGVTSDEIRGLFAVCSETRAALDGIEEARRLLASRGIRRILLSPPYGEPGWLGDAVLVPGIGTLSAEDLAEVVRTSIPLYQALIETVEEAHVQTERDKVIDVDGARGAAEGFVQSLRANPGALFHLAQYPDYDSYTINHSVRVALLAVLVGHHRGYTEEHLVELGTAGLLHDVGKGKIPLDILYKQGPLSDDEKRIMTRHTTLGLHALLESPRTTPLAHKAAFGHHIRFDKRGYEPTEAWLRPSGDTFLLQVCDVFEALTAIRPYKPPLTPQHAYGIMLADRAAFSPRAFGDFVAAVGFYPPGSRVRLAGGEEAFVVRAGARPDAPVVEVRVDASGAEVPEADRVETDLSAPGELRAVAELVREPTAAVQADPRDYEERRTTLVYRPCGHETHGSDCKICCA